MKKYVSCVLALAIILSCTSISYAEEFSIRNGIQFGMSIEQVRSIEEKNGSPKYEDVKDYDSKHYPGYSVLKIATASIGGIDTSSYGKIVYCFDKNKHLDCIVYEFGTHFPKASADEKYVKIKKTMEEKYGKSIDEGTYLVKTPVYYRWDWYKSMYGRLYHNNQWVIRFENYYVVIDLVELAMAGGTANNLNSVQVILEYKIVDAQTINDLLQNIVDDETRREEEKKTDF